MTPTPPQPEYIITEEELAEFEEDANDDTYGCYDSARGDKIRSRQIPPDKKDVGIKDGVVIACAFKATCRLNIDQIRNALLDEVGRGIMELGGIIPGRHYDPTDSRIPEISMDDLGELIKSLRKEHP